MTESRLRELELALTKCQGALLELMAKVMNVACTHFDSKTKTKLREAVDQVKEHAQCTLRK